MQAAAPLQISSIWRIVLPIIALVLAAVAALALYLPGALKAAALESTLQSNVEVSEQIKIIRGYYTQNIVSKALSTGAMQPSIDHKAKPLGIPLPATFVKDISDLLSKRDMQLSLVSPFPWPHRAERQMDEFQKTAWKAFQNAPGAVFAREQMVGGRRVMRVAVADRMTGPACVSCHNSHPDSVKRDWKLNDVRAVMEVSKVVEPYLATAEAKSRYILYAITAVAVPLIIVLLAVGVLVSRRTREKNEAVQHLHFLAHHDRMTGLLSRDSFTNQLRNEARAGALIALHFVDLDRFKDINDSLGHATGDNIIKATAERLVGLCGPGDRLTRLGGDEFVVAQVRAPSREAVEHFGLSIVEKLAETFDVDGHKINVSASVGTCLADKCEVDLDVDELLKRADIALYRAKSNGRNCHVFFAQDMQHVLTRRRELETRIWDALQESSFELHFQPIVNALNKQPEAFEALIRLPDGRGALIPPAEFIPVAEEIGAIGRIGDWVINAACAAAACWPSNIGVSVNLSAVQFGRNFEAGQGLVELVRKALNDHHLEPHRLELEITESLVMKRTENILAELRELRELGVSIAMDDFGTGYSNLSSLWQLPFTKIKIDRSFAVAWQQGTASAQAILDTIVSLGSSLEVKLTAEGVETKEQADLFDRLGCHQLQGYQFGRPMPATELASFLLKSNPEAEQLERTQSGRVGAMIALPG